MRRREFLKGNAFKEKQLLLKGNAFKKTDAFERKHVQRKAVVFAMADYRKNLG